jgi:CheY-like chemotaxis protein
MTEEIVKKKVMMVDDDKFLLDMYGLKFKACGYEIIGEPSSSEALEKLKNCEVVDIFMTDIVMPGIDGWELIKLIRENDLIPNAKIIVLSNQGDKQDLEKGVQYKVDGYIVKATSTPSEVVNKVKEIIS